MLRDLAHTSRTNAIIQKELDPPQTRTRLFLALLGRTADDRCASRTAAERGRLMSTDFRRNDGAILYRPTYAIRFGSMNTAHVTCDHCVD